MSSNTNNNESLSLKKSLKYKKGDALINKKVIPARRLIYLLMSIN
jgi:hypothetical protein